MKKQYFFVSYVSEVGNGMIQMSCDADAIIDFDMILAFKNWIDTENGCQCVIVNVQPIHGPQKESDVSTQ